MGYDDEEDDDEDRITWWREVLRLPGHVLLIINIL